MRPRIPLADAAIAPGQAHDRRSGRRDQRHAGLHGPRTAQRNALDSRADVFSLGVCPGRKWSPALIPSSKASIFATAEVIINQAPPPLEMLSRDPPDGLDHILRRALAKDPMEAIPIVHASFGSISRRSPYKRTPGRCPPMRTRPPPRVRRLVWIGAALAVRPPRRPRVAAWPVLSLLTPAPALAFNRRDWISSPTPQLNRRSEFDRSLGVALEVAIAQSRT